MSFAVSSLYSSFSGQLKSTGLFLFLERFRIESDGTMGRKKYKLGRQYEL
jgi:hypothetical protein